MARNPTLIPKILRQLQAMQGRMHEHRVHLESSSNGDLRDLRMPLRKTDMRLVSQRLRSFLDNMESSAAELEV
ncbi:hypothetical protein CLCR_07850 [Cladophialophora carrionii]|uniref:Uncharacterized protein n=1 Tax=Cladophialophora carrionii TaxID=86049 RepID=A0A1C1CPL6_9EURO|nr:hypothetical protein CLCR_07850 [Cladophialophora carrionii]